MTSLRFVMALAFLSWLVATEADGNLGPQEVRVSTLSGSGITGVADGTPAVARYMAPLGLAYDRERRLYVSDAAAQRIRVIERDGTVRTVAGSGIPIPNGLWDEAGLETARGFKQCSTAAQDWHLVLMAPFMSRTQTTIAYAALTPEATSQRMRVWPESPGQQTGLFL